MIAKIETYFPNEDEKALGAWILYETEIIDCCSFHQTRRKIEGDSEDRVFDILTFVDNMQTPIRTIQIAVNSKQLTEIYIMEKGQTIDHLTFIHN